MYMLAMENKYFNQDSLSRLLDAFNEKRSLIKYDYYKKHSNSYLALEFVYFELLNSEPYFSKKKLFRIYKKIPTTFIKYNLYSKCLDLFKKQKTQTDSAPINKPLWKDK